MTSRSYTKSYSRKVSSVTPASIQFDKLFKEHSNRPSAAKSAGTVGKWGITSFTSIRSTNINGRRDDIHNTFSAKKMKMDYAAQNTARLNSGKDPFSFDADPETTKTNEKQQQQQGQQQPPVIKPKKFFKSRNVQPILDDIRPDAAVYRQLPDSQYGRVGKTAQKQQQQQQQQQSVVPKSPNLPKTWNTATTATTTVNKKLSESSESSLNSDGGGLPREESSKPPIVLRICKGTARLVCADGQQQQQTAQILNQETESQHRINSPVPSSSSSPVNKIHDDDDIQDSTNIDLSPKSDLRIRETRSSALLSHQPIVTTVSIPLENTEMRRTTRSRAKNLQLDLSASASTSSASTVVSTPPPTTPSSSHSSGLSLTLRKSVTDSNNTLISHYDIVKTDCTPNYPVKSTIEPLIGHDQPLPTTTQELIDILSSDADPMLSRSQQQSVSTISEHEDNSENVSDGVQHCSIDLPNEEEEEEDHVSEQEMETDVPVPIIESEPSQAAKAMVDQDWFSGSDDSDGVSGNIENDPVNIPSPILEPEPAAPAANIAAKPATKKGSIFKSRSAGATTGNKRRALYKHKWCDNDKESSAADTANAGTAPNEASGSHGNSAPVAFEEEEFEPSKLTRVVSYPETDMDFTDETEAITSIRCGKKVKGFYTVVKNVKKAHQIQESGEFQEFNDDVEYILDTLRENNPNATRCLSAIRLASKCMAPAFRMHVRAHGTVAKFFKALHDATKDQSLGLCTATVMFVLSQDRLAMDLDRDCLELMLSLLESDASHKDALDDCGLSRAELLKNKEKVRQLCADIQAQGHAKHLNLDNITVGQLAMETLLSLTSRRAGEWFKEELRELGGLEHIVKTIRDCHRHINNSDIKQTGWSDPLLDKLRKVDRCLRVLENVTHMNEENQIYLLKYDDGILVRTLANLYHFCALQIPMYPSMDPADKSSTGAVVRECLFAIIKVLINLTHRFNKQSFGSKVVGSQSGVVNCSLYLLLRVPESLPEEKRFDMMMLALILLINLVEQCDDNKQLLIEARAPPTLEEIFDAVESGVEALIELFYKQEELARAEEQKTDAILDGKKDSEQTETVSTTTKSQEEFIEETVTKLLQKAGRHMEHTLIGAYVVLLLGYLVMDNKDYEMLVRSRLPDCNFSTMITVLQKFFNFMNLTASNEVSSCGIAATEKVIKFLKMSDLTVEEEKNELPLPALEDSSILLDLTPS